MADKIYIDDGKIVVSDNPLIPFIEGDGIGPDITRAMLYVVDETVKRVYNGKRKIHWLEIYAGEKAMEKMHNPLPEETVSSIKEHIVAIKGPLTTPVGKGFRSLNVTLRKVLDLYACVRPVKYINGTPSPMKEPEHVDVVIFRENTEDVYAGIEFVYNSKEAQEIRDFFKKLGVNIRDDAGIGIKPISKSGTQRLVRKAIQYAINQKRKSVTFVHKGNIMKFTEGAFKDWGYEVATQDFRDYIITEDELYDWVKDDDGVTPVKRDGAFKELRGGREPGNPGNRIVVKDRIADQMFQQMLLRPDEYDVIALPNLNGDYLSDAVAAQVGGLGMAPGANIGDYIALFEATHGTAPKYAGLDKVNPGSLILSAVMMLEYMGWIEAALGIKKGMERAIEERHVTYDLARQMEGVVPIKTSEFARAIVERI